MAFLGSVQGIYDNQYLGIVVQFGLLSCCKHSIYLFDIRFVYVFVDIKEESMKHVLLSLRTIFRFKTYTGINSRLGTEFGLCVYLSTLYPSGNDGKPLCTGIGSDVPHGDGL